MPTQLKINKGTLILLAPNATDAAVSDKNIFFSFQYNPDKIIHTFSYSQPMATSGGVELQGPPSELYYLTFELDSVDSDLQDQNMPLQG